MQRLLAAKRDLRLPQLIAQLDRYAWVVLDDIGYVQHEPGRERLIAGSLIPPRTAFPG